MVSLSKEITSKKFFQAVGRRKCAVAQVRIWTATKKESVKTGYFFINGEPVNEFLKNDVNLMNIVNSPIEKVNSEEKFIISAKVSGGGIQGQADAIRHGLARVLVEFFPNFRKKLKKAGYLTRDSRIKERKKPGLKKARKASQWKKR